MAEDLVASAGDRLVPCSCQSEEDVGDPVAPDLAGAGEVEGA